MNKDDDLDSPVNKRKRAIVFGAILVPSLIISSGKAITPALPPMLKYFSNVPISIFDLISTAQQLSALITLFILIWVAKKIGIKRTIGLGILITAVLGILPAFSDNFIFILLTRIGWGLGLGLLNALAIDSINIYFRYDERTRIRMSGYRTAMEPLGQCVLDILMGLLVMINWHLSFLSYGLIFLILIYFWKDFPTKYDKDVTATKAVKTGKAKAPKLSKKHVFHLVSLVCGLSFLMIFMVMANVCCFIEVPNLIHFLHIGNPGEAGLIIGLNTIFATFVNASFGHIYGWIHRYTVTAGVIMIAIGTILEATASNIWMLALGAICSGMAFPMFGTYSYALVGRVVPVKYETFTISILITGSNLGSFLGPLGTHYLGIFMNPTNSLVGIIRHSFVVMFIISVITVIVMTTFQAISSYHKHAKKMRAQRANA